MMQHLPQARDHGEFLSTTTHLCEDADVEVKKSTGPLNEKAMGVARTERSADVAIQIVASHHQLFWREFEPTRYFDKPVPRRLLCTQFLRVNNFVETILKSACRDLLSLRSRRIVRQNSQPVSPSRQLIQQRPDGVEHPRFRRADVAIGLD